MKYFIAAMLMVMATSAFALVDPDPNSLGFYFDETGDTVELQGAPPFSQFIVYCLLANPTFGELYGIEFGYDHPVSALMLSTIYANPLALDVGVAGNHIVGFGEPTPCEPATLIATITFINMDSNMGPIIFNLHGTEPSSIDSAWPTLLAADGELIQAGMSTAGGQQCAIVNGIGVVATETRTFDSVKSLYR